MKQTLDQLIRESKLNPSCCVLRHVTRTSRMIVAAFDAALSPAGLTSHQFTVLVTLALGGPANVNGLAAGVGTHPSTIPRLIAPLTRQGLVRVQTGRDRRERLIAITTRGNETLLRAYPYWGELQREILQGLGHRKWPELMKSLKDIRKSLDHRAQ